MTVDQFLAWAEGRPGRYELFSGAVYATSPERAGHAESDVIGTRILHAGMLELTPPGLKVSVGKFFPRP